MSRLSTSYQLGRHPRQCAATGTPLESGKPYVAVLQEQADSDELVWLGYHPEAWDAQQPPPRTLAFWNAVIPESDAGPSQRIDHHSLLDLFDQLADADDDRALALRYILALLLMRKRLLVHAGADAGDGERPPAILVRRKGAAAEDPPEAVVDPQLTPEVLADVTRRVAGALDLDERGGA